MAAAKQAQDSVSRFTVEGKPYEIAFDSLTFGECEEIEDYFGQSVDEIDFESAKGTMFIAYLAVKRKRPTYTLADARALPVEAVQPGKPEEPKSASKSDTSKSRTAKSSRAGKSA